MKRALLPLLTAAGIAVGVQAQTTLTFEEALQRALTVNNSVERARAEIGVARANRQLLLSNVLPRITATGNAVRNSTDVSFGSGADARSILARNDWSYRVVLSQPLFAGRREFRGYSQAKLGVTNAEEAERGTEDAVLLRVASNYLALVNAEALIDVERRNVTLSEKRRKQASAFFSAGEVTRVDVLRAETAIKSAQRLMALAEQNRETAASRLRADLDLDGPIVATSPEPSLPPLESEESLIRRAESSRPDVALAVNNERIAQLEIQKQRGYWFPTVTFDGGFISQKSQFPSPQYSYGALRFTVPLLQSGEVEARIAAAKGRELQARLDLEAARRGAREDVRQALAALRAAQTGLGLAQEQLTSAEAEYNQVFELYRAQEGTSLDLASSETAVAEARRAVAEESLNRQLAELRVWYAAGALQDVLNVRSGSGRPEDALDVQSPYSTQTEIAGVKK